MFREIVALRVWVYRNFIAILAHANLKNIVWLSSFSNRCNTQTDDHFSQSIWHSIVAMNFLKIKVSYFKWSVGFATRWVNSTK
jgi:hypothetical protein